MKKKNQIMDEKEALIKNKHQQNEMKAFLTQVKLLQTLVKVTNNSEKKPNHELWYFFIVLNQSET